MNDELSPWDLSRNTVMAASAGSFTHLVDADFILDKRVVGGCGIADSETGIKSKS